VLIQQLEKYLLKGLQRKQAGKTVSSPLGSLKVFDDFEIKVTVTSIIFLNKKMSEKCSFLQPSQFLSSGYCSALQWRFCHLLAEGGKKLVSQASQKDGFNAFNDSQVFSLQSAAKAFMEHLIINNFLQLLGNLPSEYSSLKPVLQVPRTIF
jgi:hypothetical protein